jgi:hypothetical protein
MDWEDVLQARGGLKALVSDLVMTWFPTTKYIVARWFVLHPDSTVRDVPGVSKSTADRLRREIFEEFRLFVQGKHPVQIQPHTNNSGTKQDTPDI